MLAAEAEVPTGQPERYLTQFCRHAGQSHRLPHARERHGDRGPAAPLQVRSAEATGNRGLVDFGSGRCTLQARDQALLLRAEASGEEDLRAIQELVTRNLERFGHREGLRVRWHRI